MKIKKNDKILVTAGKDKGKTGKVEKVFHKTSKVLVEGINLYKKHLKKRGEDKPGGIVERNRPLTVANVALICPKCQKPTRVGYKFDKSNKKYRICKKCREEI
jgi:large subunit ribosomal protein L24